MRFRKSFTLPYGYHISTKVYTKSRFLKAGGGTSDFAFWCSARQTIFLRADRLPTEQWEDYLHELDHAWTDYKEWLRQQATIMP